MMTVAASLALYQLIFKPHYWEKTKHGLHLRSSHSSSGRTTVEEEPQSEVTMQLPAFTSTKHLSPPLPAPPSFSGSTTEEEDLEVIEKLPTVRRAQRPFVHYLKRLPLQQWLNDPWLITTLVIACIASITSCW